MGALYNWSAAFCAYLRGHSIEEVALSFVIPLQAVANKARVDGWKRLANESPESLPLAARADRAEDQLAKITANRAKNYEIAAKLQEDLARLVGELVAGTLLIEKQTALGTKVSVKPSIKDRADISTYAKTVSELSYRALGDVAAPASEGGQGTAQPQINIFLPAQIAAPRSGRVELVAGHLVEGAEATTIEARLLPNEGSAGAALSASVTEVTEAEVVQELPQRTTACAADGRPAGDATRL